MRASLGYRHPSLAALVSVFGALCEGQQAPGITPEKDEEKMQTLYDLHTAGLPINGRAPEPQEPEKALHPPALGSYILDSLIASDDITRIYCRNHGTDMLEQYKTLLSEVTLFVQNAWQVDFNLPLASFAGYVGGVRGLVVLGAHSRLGPGILFVSSISAVAGWASHNTSSNTNAVPDAGVEDWRATQHSRRGQAKLVAERILDAAARTAGFPTAICRAAQVAGPSMSPTGDGRPKLEWVPSLMETSRHLGLARGRWWVAGRTTAWTGTPSTRWAGSSSSLAWVFWVTSGGGVAPLRRPIALARRRCTGRSTQMSRWQELVPVVADALGGAEVVPLELWVAALRKIAPKTEGLNVNPAVKILELYEGLVEGGMIHLDTANTLEHSATLAKLGPVERNMMKRCMEQ